MSEREREKEKREWPVIKIANFHDGRKKNICTQDKKSFLAFNTSRALIY